MPMWGAIAREIGAATGEAFVLAGRQDAGGGCINQAAQLEGVCGRRYFVKYNRADCIDMFEAEAEGLVAIRASATLVAPQPICTGTTGAQAFLVMQHLKLGGQGDEAALAWQLAAMHRHTQPQFGWHRDNTIGATPQRNPLRSDWPDFWREARLGYQLTLAKKNGASSGLLSKGEMLMAGLDRLFSGYRPVPSLLHGDLWGGNYGFVAQKPAVFDPAVYFGDREADMAMTELFGGFSATFYAAYQEAWPLDAGYEVRKGLYNLYHIINHFNLFGGGYADQAERMASRLLAEMS